MSHLLLYDLETESAADPDMDLRNGAKDPSLVRPHVGFLQKQSNWEDLFVILILNCFSACLFYSCASYTSCNE